MSIFGKAPEVIIVAQFVFIFNTLCAFVLQTVFQGLVTAPVRVIQGMSAESTHPIGITFENSIKLTKLMAYCLDLRKTRLF